MPKLERTLPPPSPPTKLLLDPAVESAVVGPALLAANLATTVVRDILGLRPDRLRFSVPFEDSDGTVRGWLNIFLGAIPCSSSCKSGSALSGTPRNGTFSFSPRANVDFVCLDTPTADGRKGRVVVTEGRPIEPRAAEVSEEFRADAGARAAVELSDPLAVELRVLAAAEERRVLDGIEDARVVELIDDVRAAEVFAVEDSDEFLAATGARAAVLELEPLVVDDKLPLVVTLDAVAVGGRSPLEGPTLDVELMDTFLELVAGGPITLVDEMEVVGAETFLLLGAKELCEFIDAETLREGAAVAVL